MNIETILLPVSIRHPDSTYVYDLAKKVNELIELVKKQQEEIDKLKEDSHTPVDFSEYAERIETLEYKIRNLEIK